jgi:delta24-sterol reductase
VDIQRQIIRTEPLVDMRYMTRHLVPMGYQLAIQVEMEDLTIGGLTMGLGMETNSHILGLIQETVVAFEVVLSDGKLVRATRDENADLFHALPWSHGTLGFLVAVELKIVKIKPYMHVTYIPCHTKVELCSRMKQLSEAEDAPSFLEATVYSKETSVIMTGEFSDKPQDPSKINHVNRFWKTWYYVWVEGALGPKGQFDEYIPVRDYYHRFTRSIFWELRDLIPFGNHPVYRYLLGWLGAPKVSFLKLTMTPQIRKEVVYKHVVQVSTMLDVLITLIALTKLRYSRAGYHHSSRRDESFH